jgi:serine/threonine protein kinase
MSISPFRIEQAILRAIALVPDGPWVQCSLGNLRSRITEIDAEVAQESSNLLIDALVSLCVQEHLELSKIEAGQRSRFDFQRKRDDKYLNQFFGFNSFDVRTTHEGRKRISTPASPTLNDKFPNTLESARNEIDYWVQRQTEGDPESIFHRQVTDRLTQLRSLEQRFLASIPSQRVTTSDARICTGVFSTYSLGKNIGSGGAGIVYEARTEDDELCAVKILKTDQTSKAKRFKNEIFFGVRNRHRNIISALDFGRTADAKIFYVMPIYSSTLRKLISDGIKKEGVLDFFAQILDGVEAAHQRDVCHRDLKPENILFDEVTATLVIADFGIARFKEQDLQTAIETGGHEKLANFQYAAPEQRIRGRVVDHRADIYALGLILNEMFTGDVLQGTGFKRIGSIAAKYSYLDPVIDSMVQQAPENRPASISDLRRLLRLGSTSATPKADPFNAPAQAKVLSSEERERTFEEADIDFAIRQGMQQTFIVSFHNKAVSNIEIRKLKLSYQGIKILEAPPPQTKTWQLESMRSQEYSWQANPDPVTALMQIQGEWEKPFNVALEIFIQIEILGRIKTFENRKIFCQVEPNARRIWQRL